MHHPDIKKIVQEVKLLKSRFAKRYHLDHLDGPQGKVIVYLTRHNKEEVFQKHIENSLHISKSVASELIQRMEKNGFISTHPYDKDKRYKVIRLTALGEEKCATIENFHTMMKQLVFDQISDEELQLFFNIFYQLEKNILQANQFLDLEEENNHDQTF